MPPQKADSWTATFDASSFGAGCFQSRANLDIGLGDTLDSSLLKPSKESEDCLTLNIWAPSKDRIPEGGATVMVRMVALFSVRVLTDEP